MRRVVAGRKMPADSAAGVASAAATRIGAGAVVSTLSPACATAQIEHTWCDVAVESSGWACRACAAPIANTKAMESTHTALVKTLGFADFLAIPLGCCWFRPVALDDSTVKTVISNKRRAK